VTFKITIGSKFNNDHLKFNDDFKSHPTFRRTRVFLLALLLKEREREE
jgi:hypothetical protein